MKAIRKSDGKIIEVKPYCPPQEDYDNYKCYPFEDYYITSDNEVLSNYDLDFGLEEAEEVTIDGWMARDSNGTLWICSEEPQRYSDWWIIDTDEEYTKKELPSYLFPSLTWQSDPLEVTLTIKPKKKSSTE